MSDIRHYGQYKYSKLRKSWNRTWRILNYLECMRDWGDLEWIPIYQDAISFYIEILNGESFMQVVEQGYKDLGIELKTEAQLANEGQTLESASAVDSIHPANKLRGSSLKFG